MLEAVGFMFFSIIETVAVYYLVMAIFRFDPKEFIWESLFVSLLINLQSYILRNELSLSYFVPLITIVIFTFFFAVVVKYPIIWALICSVFGYAIYAVLQIILAVLLFGSIANAQSTESNGYLLQFACGTIAILISIGLYKTGWGFKFDFEKLRFKFEDMLVVGLIISFLVLVSIIFYYQQLFMLIIFFVSTVIFLLYYAVWKEKTDQ